MLSMKGERSAQRPFSCLPAIKNSGTDVKFLGRVALWEKALDETGITDVMSHDSYLINLGSPDWKCSSKAARPFASELERCHLLKIPYLNFHPGAATTGTPRNA